MKEPRVRVVSSGRFSGTCQDCDWELTTSSKGRTVSKAHAKEHGHRTVFVQMSTHVYDHRRTEASS